MDPVIAFAVICWAFYHVAQDVNAVRRADRDKQTPAERQRRASNLRHAIGWWAREIAHGFPVTTAAWHTGWLSHHAAAEQHQHIRDQHRDTVDTLRKVRQQGTANATRIKRDQLPVRTRRDRKQTHLTLTQPAPGDPAPPTVPQPAAQPTQPTQPTTPQPPPTGSPRPNGRTTHQPAAPAQPQPTEGAPPMTTQTVAVPEITYTQAQDKATKDLIGLEARLAELHAEQMAAFVEAVASSLSGGGTVTSAADMLDSINKEMQAVKQRIEVTQQFKDQLRREHGGINEAVSNSPVSAAQPEFYEN